MTDLRDRLQTAARRNAHRQHHPVRSPRAALARLFIGGAPGQPKRGELFEVLLARSREELVEEWGDCGYYIAQTWGWLWQLYAWLTPRVIIAHAVRKFERRAAGRDK